MGQTAENVRELEGVTRQEMDEFAVRSQERAVAAIDNGFFEREIVPVTLPDGSVVSTDDGPRRGTTLEELAQLKPVFRPDGEITAGNACPLNDGAAAVVVMSDTQARELGIDAAGPHRRLGRLGPQPGDHGPRPDRGLPPGAGPGRHEDGDVDLVEINEAFAAQVIPSARHLGIPSTSSTCTAAPSPSATRSG